MKAIILYRPNTETETSVLEYVREFAHRTGKTLDLINVDSVQGVEIAKLYDILQFPAILAIEDDGHFLQSWTEFEKWPTMNELTFYTRS